MAIINKRFVDSVSPDIKDRIYMDDVLKGFGLKVTPAGRKVYILQYRTGGRGMPTKRLTLDIHGRITAEQARKAAYQALNERAQGVDPVEKKRQARKKPDNIFASAFEMFKAKHLSTLRSGEEVGRAMERVLMQRWGKLDVAAIRKAQIIDAVEKVADGGSKYAANRMLAYIHKFFNWCLARDLVPFNPAAGIEKPTIPVERDRVLTDDEIRLLWRVWEGMDYPFGFFYRVLLLTAQRRDEVATMRWADIDFKKGIWTIPREMTKADRGHEVPLSKPVLLIFEALKPMESGQGRERLENDRRSIGEYVFSGSGRSPLSGFSKAKRRLDELSHALKREDAVAQGRHPEKEKPIPAWRIHDLRRTAATNMARAGISMETIGRVLNHSVQGVTRIYDRASRLPEKTVAMNAWAARLSEILGDTHQSANVVYLGVSSRNMPDQS